MIYSSNVNSLQKQKLDLQIKLNELLKSNNKNDDEINELKSEIIYLNKRIEKIVGSNEIERQNQLRRKKLGIDQKNLNDYYEFKDKYKKISKMKIATNHIISLIESVNLGMYQTDVTSQEIVKVK